MIEIIFITAFILLFLLIYLCIRNEMIFKERRKILKGLQDNTYYSFGEKLNEYDSISYDEMLFKFWKPIKSFYDYEIFKKQNRIIN